MKRSGIVYLPAVYENTVYENYVSIVFLIQYTVNIVFTVNEIYSKFCKHEMLQLKHNTQCLKHRRKNKTFQVKKIWSNFKPNGHHKKHLKRQKHNNNFKNMTK